MPYLCITRLTRFLPILSRAASLRWERRIILLMQLLNRHRFIFTGLARLPVVARTRKVEGTRDLAFAIGAVGRRQLSCQFHGSRAAVSVPTAPALSLRFCSLTSAHQ